MISFSQNFEDVILWRALNQVENGFYIDVGANDPTVDSVTRVFYDKGWHGINIEPVAQWFDKLNQQRPKDTNLQLAVGQSQAQSVLYEMPDTGLSTTHKTIAEQHQNQSGVNVVQRSVTVTTLTDICQQHCVTEVHFLKIDVEGTEGAVLEGLDLSTIRPWIIVVESTLPGTRIESHQDWEPSVLAHDYEYVYFDGLNRYYLAQEHHQLKSHFAIAPNLFDGFEPSGCGSSSFHRPIKVAKVENEKLSSELDTSNNQNQVLVTAKKQLNDELQSAQSQVNELNLVLQQTLKERDQRFTELTIAQGKVDALHLSSLHWQAVAQARASRVTALEQSLSWRITSPLRWVLKLFSKQKRTLSITQQTTPVNEITESANSQTNSSDIEMAQYTQRTQDIYHQFETLVKSKKRE
jgi:FkbM family methyltransferase